MLELKTLLLYVTASLAIAGGVATGVQTFRLNAAENTINQLELKSEAASKKYMEDLLKQERLTSERIANLTSRHLATQQEANTQYEKVLGDLRADNLRLRDRFVCPKPNPGASPDPSGSASEAPTGLLEADVQFLVSEAKRADDVVRQLMLAQELLTIYKRHYDELRARQE